MSRDRLTRFAWLSIFAALITIGLKTAAYWYTGSVSLLSDALESLINLAAATVALLMLKAADTPPDEEHAFGHDKAEYFAGAIEGTLILIAAVGIGWAAIPRLFQPPPLENLNLGLIVTGAATAVNFAVGLILIRVGREQRSLTLEADGKHLMTDVWTSIGVIVGVFLVSLTGWLILDPIIALIVAVNIIWTGVHLLKRSAQGLMDAGISPREKKAVHDVLNGYVKREGIDFHALRTRQSGKRSFVSVHILVPGSWTVHRGHELLERIESDVRQAVDGAVVFTHLESLDDPASWSDMELDRMENFPH